eukprot:TRINITY_DN63483_c0_g1_i1.p1 TRINITY_DN63483_c0_g1~~TRINITY_DN63483_c0_g1_i1.p1  ORF type:complete len:566 (-),score=55.86 TRINITY_DN63483_c0_g1_i1:25-1722(-)
MVHRSNVRSEGIVPLFSIHGDNARCLEEEDLLRHEEAPLATTVNPFANPAAWTPYEIIKGLICLLCIFPFRLTLLIIVVTCEMICCFAATVGTKLSVDGGCHRHTKPFSACRRRLLYPCSVLNRLFLGCFGFWPGCIRVNDYRQNKAKCGKILVVAPHTSFLDSFMVAWAFPPFPSGLGHSGILGIPFMKSLAAAGQAILVDRNNTESKQACKVAIVERTAPSWTGAPLMIFPEGVLTNAGALIQFKMGAFVPGSLVTLVTLRYKCRYFHLAGCGKNHNLGLTLLRTALQFANFCEISILENYLPSATESQSPALFAQNVRSVMARHLGVPTTEHSYLDAAFSYKSKAHVGCDFEMRRLQTEYSCTVDQLTEAQKVFEFYDMASVGAISFEDFDRVLHAPVQPRGEALFEGWEKRSHHSTLRLFAFFDHDRSGFIEFRDFIEAVAVLSNQRSVASCTRMAFLLADILGNDGISKTFLEQVPFVERERDVQTAEGANGDDNHGDVIGFAGFSQLVELRPEALDRLLACCRKQLGFPHLGRSRGEQVEYASCQRANASPPITQTSGT